MTVVVLAWWLAVMVVVSSAVVGRYSGSVGTRSVAFGAHCWFVHPWFVAAAWWKLYGPPFDPRLWVAFFVHDLGYIGRPNMDGPEGERHPEFGADVMFAVTRSESWRDFVLYHSRFYALRDNTPPSRLCVADKLAISLTPAWLYLPMVRLTGELAEYRAHHDAAKRGEGKYAGDKMTRPYVAQTDAEWYARIQDYCRRWALAHRDGRRDEWTGQAQRRTS